MLRSLGQSIAEVRELSVGKQAFPSNKAHDLALVSRFDNAESLERFRLHPAHIRTRDFIARIADWVIVDYEY
jgi:hypothetical protein